MLISKIGQNYKIDIVELCRQFKNIVNLKYPDILFIFSTVRYKNWMDILLSRAIIR